VIYQLNNQTHWELSPELMRELVVIATARIREPAHPGMLIELCNFRSALECELQRLPPDNTDLIG